MPESPLNIPLEQNFVLEMTKNIEKYLPVLDENIKAVKNLLSKDQYDRVRQYHEQQKTDTIDQGLMKKILDSVIIQEKTQISKKDFTESIEDKKQKKFNNAFWKQYKSTIGKDFSKFMPLISENMGELSKFLTENQKSKIERYDKQKEILEKQEDLYNMISEAQKYKGELGIKEKVQTTVSGGKKSEEFNKKFDKRIEVLADNFTLVADYLTGEQKRKIQEYQQKEELKEKEKQITQLLKTKEKSKYTKIKEKLYDKYNNFIIRHRWFEKSVQAFKDLKQKAVGLAGGLLKAGLMYLLFKDEFDKIFKYLKPELLKIWSTVQKNLIKVFQVAGDFLLQFFAEKLPKGVLEFLGIDAQTIQIEKEVSKRVQQHIQNIPKNKPSAAERFLGMSNTYKTDYDKQMSDIVKLRKLIEENKKDPSFFKKSDIGLLYKQLVDKGGWSKEELNMLLKSNNNNIEKVAKTIEESNNKVIKAIEKNKPNIEFKTGNDWINRTKREK
jgi:hypothetical protein